MFTPGDLVTPNTRDVYLLSEMLETATDATQTYYGVRTDLLVFKPGTMAIVIEVNPLNTARVKVLYDTTFWWTNSSELRVVR